MSEVFTELPENINESEMFSKLDLKQWEQYQILKDCSKAFYVGQKVWIILGDFVFALRILSGNESYYLTTIQPWFHIEKGLT